MNKEERTVGMEDHPQAWILQFKQTRQTRNFNMRAKAVRFTHCCSEIILGASGAYLTCGYYCFASS